MNKKLYNEERKQRYINKKESEVTLAPHFLKNLFTKSAPFEEALAKDISEFTLSEIMEFYKYIDAYSLESLALINSNYSMYTTWALAETLVPDGQNHFLEVGNDIMAECLNSSLFENTIITREELEKHADTLPNYVDRFVIYAIFEGICGKWYEEITSANLSDIHRGEGNLAGGIMKLCTGRLVPVTPKFIDVANLAAEEKTYQSYMESGAVYKYRECPGGQLFKMSKNRAENLENDQKNKAQVLNRRYNHAIDFMGLPRQLTAKRLMVSGKLEYIKGIMVREGLPLEETIRKYADEINDRYPVEKFKGSYAAFMRKYRRILMTGKMKKKTA